MSVMPFIFLLFLLCFAEAVHAAEVQIHRLSNNLIEVRGGVEPKTWHIQYGSERSIQALTLAGPGNIAYFTHGSWLRRVDVEQGVVTGRWRMPGDSIVGLTWAGNRIQVTVEQRSLRERLQRKIVFDSAAPDIPSWGGRVFAPDRAGSVEPYRMSTLSIRLNRGTLTSEDFQQLIPEAENAARRDPIAPRHRILLGRLYRSAGTNDGRSMFEEAVRIEPAYFAELFSIADTLQRLGEKEIARIAYERGYADFWGRGFDPRLLSFPLEANLLPKVERSGTMHLTTSPLTTILVAANVFFAATAAAAFLYVVVLFLRYRTEKVEKYFNFEYWTVRQRIAFGTIVALAWLACGFGGTAWRGMTRAWTFEFELGGGSFAGPAPISILEMMPPAPDRDFLLAIAYHQDRQLEKAEPLYRAHQQFAESWNNLGVLLKDSGRSNEAREAFERAAQIDSQLAEARLNLGSPPSNIWTEFHSKYRPGKAMIAPPRREHMLRAALGGTTFDVFLQSLKGVPALGGEELRDQEVFDTPIFLVGASTLLVMGLLALPLLLAPLRDAVQPKTRLQSVVEHMFPGTAPRWSYAGGLILVLWCFSVLIALWAVNAWGVIRGQ